MLDLARSRVRDPVLLPGPHSKRMKLGAPCVQDDEDWEIATQNLALTLEEASLVMIEDNGRWKVVEKPSSSAQG